MTEKRTIWQRINTPLTWKILPWVIIAISVLAFVFGYIPTPEKDRKILQYQDRIHVLEEGKKDDSLFREIMISKIDVLQNSVNTKETSKQIIYERIRTDIHHYDTASIAEYQRFFDNRYNTPKGGTNTRPGAGNNP